MATLEVVLTTGLVLPMVAFLGFTGIRACIRIYEVVANLVALPFL